MDNKGGNYCLLFVCFTSFFLSIVVTTYPNMRTLFACSAAEIFHEVLLHDMLLLVKTKFGGCLYLASKTFVMGRF